METLSKEENMKDLEKIKSEDLGCQVADANPGNFGIEQEVAQLVGATVPAPTEPSADDARELGAQLLVFLRRALTPIQLALLTELADIYAHLDSRCTAYTPAAYDPFMLPAGPYDPMRPFVPRTLPNLLQAITAFSPRKISNGSAPNDGIADGVSLAHLLNDAASVTAIVDDNHGWTMTQQFPWSMFTGVTKFHLGCGKCYVPIVNKDLDEFSADYLEYWENNSNVKAIAGLTKIPKLSFGRLRKIKAYNVYASQKSGGFIWGCSNLKEVDMDVLEELETSLSHVTILCSNPDLETWYAPKLRNWNNCEYLVYDCPSLKRVVFGKLEHDFNNAYGSYENNFVDSTSNLEDFEIGAGTAVNLHLNWWNPTNVLADADKTATFLQNFKDHIALRLTDQGSDLTLTLSQSVRNAIHAAESTYGIEDIIVNQKHWTLSPAPSA